MSQEYRLITYKQVEDLLIYGYENGRVFKNPGEGEVMQGFYALPALHISEVVECLRAVQRYAKMEKTIECHCLLCNADLKHVDHRESCESVTARRLIEYFSPLTHTNKGDEK